MFLLPSLLEDPKAPAVARRLAQGSRVRERPRLWRGRGLEPAEHDGKLKSPETSPLSPLPRRSLRPASAVREHRSTRAHSAPPTPAPALPHPPSPPHAQSGLYP